MTAFGQVGRTTSTDLVVQSSPNKVSVFAALDATLQAPIQGGFIFPQPIPSPTIRPKVPRVPQQWIEKGFLAPGGTCPTPWQFVAGMPVAVYGVACASDGTFAYCAGGGDFFGVVNGSNRYDPSTNTWTALAPMPNGAAMAAAVYYPPTHRIYVFGGGNGSPFPTGEIYNFNQIYDIGSNTWTTGTPLPDVRAFMAYGYNPGNGKIYLVGGYNTAFDDSGQPDTWEYDPVADTYTNKTEFPELAGGYASGIINGHLYVAGGRNAANSALNTLWDYDIAANTWTQKSDMPSTRNNVRGSAVALDSLFVFGGVVEYLDFGSHATNVYLPATDEWRTSASMNQLRAWTSGATIGTNIYAAAGYSHGGFTAGVEVLAACIPEPTPTLCPYSITPGTDTILPGDIDIGSHCDDCDTGVTLPFPFVLYNQTYTSVNVSSNGRLDFVSGEHEPFGYGTSCLPPSPFQGGINDERYDFTIFALWEDMRTDFGLSGCTSFPGGNCGVFTSVSGNAPNRIFNIEWRTVLYADNSATQNFEVRLYENDLLKKFEVIIGTLNTADAGQTYVSGVQGDSDYPGFVTQDFCTSTPPQNVSRTYTFCGPALRPSPTARPRPTPHPRP